MAFNFAGEGKEEDKKADPLKADSLFGKLVDSMKSMKGGEEKKATPPAKLGSLTDLRARAKFYQTLSKEELIDYAREVDEACDLLLAGTSLMVEAVPNLENMGGKDGSLGNVAKLLIVMAGQRVKKLRRVK